MAPSKSFPPGLQYLPPTSALEDILTLLKRDGAVVVRSLVSESDLDDAYTEIKPALEADAEWDGEFFPKETKRANGLIGISPTYVRSQLMHPLFQAIANHFLTTRSTYWWGDKRKESVSLPYVTSTVAIQVGPGATAQPLHCDSYIGHRVVDAIDAWDDERDLRSRETSVGMFVAGCDVCKENGGTQVILGSHLWSSCPDTPPPQESIIVPTLRKGDAFFMLTSLMHGGGNNTTTDQQRLVWCSFATRGFLRQEENMFLAVPQEAVKQYDRAAQRFTGYYVSEPACGVVEQRDPIYVLYPEEVGSHGGF
ncbi:phytanoyl-CoA dioxygenase family protein [Aspergillus mulundensis]|uniref:Phytanoyl-CoA dioxygenase family protein n=1 Tax=Aspergillus mulundensis TaxID=1810919 RepID=A0A3D8T327_9EURO|nr:Uncharacterized protein DSM5745_00276 [Aspergillus mulundensis]RDW92954.1 Uncharacterized protein DSM5745_00276 [Aspergillus mulundensis]